MNYICIKDVLMEMDLRKTFTKGYVYKFEKFNSYNGIDSYFSFNDQGQKHLLGRLDDEWVKSYFKSLQNYSFNVKIN